MTVVSRPNSGQLQRQQLIAEAKSLDRAASVGAEGKVSRPRV